MSYIQAIILSLVEGITEFLPISSTGHLILVSELMAIPQTEFIKTFQICIQFGAICAVIFLYASIIRTKRYVLKTLMLAFLPSAIIGLLLYKIIKGYLIGNSFITVAALILGGLLFIIIEKRLKQRELTTTIQSITNRQAVLIGVGQSLAVIPGVSRSASTILTGMMLGLNRNDAVEFSFLLAVPTIVAATALDLYSTSMIFTSTEISLLLVGCIGSFLSATVAIRFLLSYIQTNTFIPFGIYRIITGVLYWWFILR